MKEMIRTFDIIFAIEFKKGMTGQASLRIKGIVGENETEIYISSDDIYFVQELFEVAYIKVKSN